jgi:hypothetical protein
MAPAAQTTAHRAAEIWLNATALAALPDPLILPSFASPGDEVSALMLPASPEISYLPQAFSEAAKRFGERQLAIITFVDPTTGVATDESTPTPEPPVKDQSWLLVDSDLDDTTGVMPSDTLLGQIRWDSHPA